jgi:chromosomal replication initiation ATPase DnaA
MKKGVFKEYLERVLNTFNITQEDIFTKSKRRDLVDARHLLYYLCYHRPMQIRYIQEYMEDYGYKVGHSSIIHGIEQVSDKVSEDMDYDTICRELA